MFTRLIIAIGRRYVQYINATYRRTGTLWDSRYKSLLIQAETYLLGCQLYIEFNPVRAAMVDHPVHYRWTVIVTTPLGNPSLSVRRNCDFGLLHGEDHCLWLQVCDERQ